MLLMAAAQRIAIVGATGAVGQTTLKLLEERNFPVRDLRLFASERSVGKTMDFKGESLAVRKIDADAFKGIDIVFFSAGADQSREFATIAVNAGAIVIDKSSAFRMNPEVPLVVPEINGVTVRRHNGIVACPNCTTIVTVMPLKPLHDLGKLRRVVATSFQAVSRSWRQWSRRTAYPNPRMDHGRATRAEIFPTSDRVQRNPSRRQVP
jgi:aspartate-semialdehyde dehydrogenase